LVGSVVSSYHDCGGRRFAASFSNWALERCRPGRFLGGALVVAPVVAITFSIERITRVVNLMTPRTAYRGNAHACFRGVSSASASARGGGGNTI